MRMKPQQGSPVRYDESPNVAYEARSSQFARTERLANTSVMDVEPGMFDGEDNNPSVWRPWPEYAGNTGKPGLRARDRSVGTEEPKVRRTSTAKHLLPRGLAILLILVAGLIAIGPVRAFVSAHESDGNHHTRQTAPIATTLPSGATTTTLASTPTATGVSLPIAGRTANMQFTAQGNASGPNQPGLQGADIEIRWNWLEPNAPINGVHQYDWAQFDSTIARWHAAGKRVMLLVHYTDYTGSCSSQQEMPAWEIARIQHVCDSAYGVVTPNYFDPTFITDLRTFVHAIGDHYAASPYKGDIAYVRVGTGIGGEEIPNRGGPTNLPVWNQLQQWGYTPIAWRNWVESRLSDYQAAFPYTTVLNSVNTLWATDPAADPTTGMTGLSIQSEIAYWAAAHGFGIGCQTLSPGFDYAKIREITTYIRAHWPQTFIEFQTKTGVASVAEVQGDIQTAYCYGAKAIEWYANVANTASYQQAFQTWEQLSSGQMSAATANIGTCP